MPEYHFIDGPLAGQTLASSEPHTEGEVLAIEVVDMDQHPDQIPRFDYYVESGPDQCRPGRLRHSALHPEPRTDRVGPSTAA
ncbi:hypothetical protein [Cellulomonas sp. KRMCY2]|uniref:hypothetical protein n=1 Tax=Cellulomonas sp. KRMCY2 TaxID=1304865 RepID=UPI00045EBDFC|nr:hypothetical protein [Cellulomonas sp. KRMCY2]